jgi:N-acetylglucosaminyl-diphospho-decaprenol L-rhamnosyltransferase
MDKLIIVIVSWNTLELTRQCLVSTYAELERLEVAHEVWVVDNASSDGSVEMIRKEFAPIRLIVNSENVGFARANNQALREADGSHYLLLNSDTIVHEGAFGAMLGYMGAHPEAAAVGPRLVYANGGIQKSFTRLPTLWGEFCYSLVFHFFPFGGLVKALLGWDRTDLAKIVEPREAEVLSAACLMLRREALEKVGVLGEGYFLFSEENDYFIRLKRAGLRSFYLPSARITHLVGASRKRSGEINSAANFLRSRIVFFQRFYPEKVRAMRSVYRFFLTYSLALASLSFVLKGRRDDHYIRLYRELLKTLGEVSS